MSRSQRRAMIDREEPNLSLVRQCALLGISRVGCQRFWTVLGPRDWGEEAPGLRVSLTS